MIARCFPHYRSHTGLEQCVWLRCSSVMSRATVSACVLSQDLSKLKMVHVRLYSVGRGGKVFSWTLGSAWRFRVFDYLLWNSKSFQLIHLKYIFSLGPFTPCGGLNVLEVFDSELDIESGKCQGLYSRYLLCQSRNHLAIRLFMWSNSHQGINSVLKSDGLEFLHAI